MSFPFEGTLSARGDSEAVRLLPTLNQTEAGSSPHQSAQHVLPTRFSEELKAALESPDPVAGLDEGVETMADELSRASVPTAGADTAFAANIGIGGAVEALVRVALEMEDPVAALEEGTESLAEALAARDASEKERLHAAEESRHEHEAAYRHARLHRVGELIDVGYSLDQAVAITNKDEAEICARAAAAGRDPMELIYKYATLHGYAGSHPTQREPLVSNERLPPRRSGDEVGSLSSMETLARLDEDAFAKATEGDRWRALMRR